MPFCPNPECRFRERQGRPAEYRAGFTTCSDCGTALVEQLPEPVAPAAPPPAATADASEANAAPASTSPASTSPASTSPASTSPVSTSAVSTSAVSTSPASTSATSTSPAATPGARSGPSELTRFAVTVGIFLAVTAASFVPLPGTYLLARGGLLGLFGVGAGRGLGRMFQIGLDPFIWSFLLVELVALAIPPLNRRRLGNADERRPLTTAAITLGLLSTVVQARALVQVLEGGGAGESLVGGATPSGLLLVLLVAPTLLLLGLAALNDRFGLANGMAVVFGASAFANVLANLSRLVSWVNTETLSAATALIVLLVWVGVGLLTARVVRGPAKVGERPGWVPQPLSTLWPITLAATFLGLLYGWGPRWLFDLQRRTLGEVASGFVTFDLALLLAFLFFRPSRVRLQWERWRPGVDGAAVEEWARRALPRGVGVAAAFCVGCFGLPVLLGRAFDVPLTFGLVNFVALVATAADVLDESRARRRLGALVNVRELSRLTEVEPAMSALAAASIPVHPRAVRFRSVGGFFSPYAPVVLLVPAAREAEARALLDR